MSAALWKLVAKQGRARAIVQLRLETDFQVDATGDKQRAQRREIQSVASRLLHELAASGHQGPIESATVYASLPYLALEVGPSELEHLSRSESVVLVVPDAYLHVESDAALPRDPVLDDTAVLVGAKAASDQGLDGSDWWVVVIDTGVDNRHSFLASTAFLGSAAMGSRTTPLPDPPEEGRPHPLAGVAECFPTHGTSMACIACGSSGTTRGIAPGAGVISIRVSDDPRSVRLSNVVQALDQVETYWRMTVQVAAVSMSLAHEPGAAPGCPPVDVDPLGTFALAARQLVVHEIAVVAGAGNAWAEDAIAFPACLDDVVAVGATREGDRAGEERLTSYSNASAGLDLLAPGSAIAFPTQGGVCEIPSGTSNSAPQVAAAFALLRQKYPMHALAILRSALLASGPLIEDLRYGASHPGAPARYFRRLAIDEALRKLVVP